MRFILVLLVLIMGSQTAQARCGMELRFDADVDRDELYRDRTYEDDTSFGISLVMPFGDPTCDLREAQTRKEHYRVQEQKLKNLEKAVKICKTNPDLNICSRLNDLF